MMKKILALLLIFILSLSITGCASDDHEYDPSEGNVLITDDMIPDIQASVLDYSDTSELSFLFKNDALRCANERVAVMTGYEDINEFYDIKITSEGFKDDWHYCFYGKIYATDKYNNYVNYDFYLLVACKEDPSTEKGYTVTRAGVSIDI